MHSLILEKAPHHSSSLADKVSINSLPDRNEGFHLSSLEIEKRKKEHQAAQKQASRKGARHFGDEY